ncbi:phospholipid scramblase 1-like [Myxocyprinus asiaticus]|uniref:phospholipid scramblase 1-like n=1 Tax=Myxocyprinus asiaticus TaxID=70543 RepID=UPI00222268D9|nr:phospholipid scramblase 1-like [Myxocyprinus asiaticus]
MASPYLRKELDLTDQIKNGIFRGQQNDATPRALSLPFSSGALDQDCSVVCSQRPNPGGGCGRRSNNRYVVKDDAGNKVLDICEENEWCTRQCCGPARSFIMSVMNNSNHEVIRLVRPYVCNCCQNELEVQSPPGIAIGNVRQNWHFCRAKFTVENEQGQPVFKIVGPTCTCCTDENFELMSLNGAVIDRSVGKIFKPFTYSGPNAAADFVLKFPSRLEVKLKAVILGACILIDCMYYEKK